MTTTPIPRYPAAPAWLRTLDTARIVYLEWFGWPVDVDITGRRLVTIVRPPIAALAVPPSLAARLSAAARLGPVVAGPVWTFFTRAPDAAVLSTSLVRAGVRWIDPGQRLAVPAEPDQTSWIVPPAAHRPLPTAAAVIDVAHRVLALPAHRAA